MGARHTVSKRIDITQAVADLAPPAPPCFDARDIWLRYLVSSVESQRGGYNAGPLALDQRGQVRPDRLNPEWSFCTDCVLTRAEKDNLISRGACQPRWWSRHVPPMSPEELAYATARHRKVIPIARQQGRT